MSETEFREIGGWPAIFARLFAGDDLSAHQARAAFGEILADRSTSAQIAAFAAALRTKGETVEEITAFVEAMRAHSDLVVLDVDAIDTCGTGGDKSGTINISTVAAFVVAGVGVPVCKHGNRAASSLSGSADVLEALGVVIDLGPAGVARCVVDAGIGFCFAPRFHPAMRYTGPVRRELGVATVFNFLGPLANPGRVRRQIIGVGDPAMAETMLGVLEAQGCRHAMVLYGDDGLDELSTVGPSTIHETKLDASGARTRRVYRIDPRELGIAPATAESLRGGDTAVNTDRVRALLGGESGPQRDIVVLNAAAALVVAGRCEDIAAGLPVAEDSLQSGAASETLERFVASSKAIRADGID